MCQTCPSVNEHKAKVSGACCGRYGIQTLLLAPSVTQNVPPRSQQPRPVKKAIERETERETETETQREGYGSRERELVLKNFILQGVYFRFIETCLTTSLR